MIKKWVKYPGVDFLRCISALFLILLLINSTLYAAVVARVDQSGTSVSITNNTNSSWTLGGIRFLNEGWEWTGSPDEVWDNSTFRIINRARSGGQNEVNLYYLPNAQQDQAARITPGDTRHFNHPWGNFPETTTPVPGSEFLLLRTGAPGVPDDPIGEDPITLSQLDRISNLPAFYDPAYRPEVYDSLGVRGGRYSAGMMDTWLGETQLQIAIPTETFRVSNTDLTVDQSQYMFWMGIALSQEYLNIDMQTLMGIGIKETFAGTNAFREDFINGTEFTPFHVEGPSGLDRAMNYPSFFPKFEAQLSSARNSTELSISNEEFMGYYTRAQDGRRTVMNSATTINGSFFPSLFLFANYDVVSYAQDICWREGIEISREEGDPYLGLSAMIVAYNQGLWGHMGNIAEAFGYPQYDQNARTLDRYHFGRGNNNYLDDFYTGFGRQFIEASRLSLADPSIELIDFPVSRQTMTDVFFGDNGTVQNQGDGGILRFFFDDETVHQNVRQRIWDTINGGFDILRGRAPSVSGDNISFRYDFLPLLRTVKGEFDFTRRLAIAGDAQELIQRHSGSNSSCSGFEQDNEYPYLSWRTQSEDSETTIVRATITDETEARDIKWSMDQEWRVWRDAQPVDVSNPQSKVFDITVSREELQQSNMPGNYIWLKATDASGNSTLKRISVTFTSVNDLEIFYGDTLQYDPNAELRGEAGQRLPVVIRATSGGERLNVNAQVQIILSSDLVAYQSENATDPISSVNLSGGEVRIWVTGVNEVDNGSIIVTSDEHNLQQGTRSRIFFSLFTPHIEHGIVYANNGYGQVDYLEVYYGENLTQETIPDSIELFWPNSSGERRVVDRNNISLDPADSRIVRVNFPQPFPAGITTFTGSNDELGTQFYWNPLTPDVPTQATSFKVIDSVGPLLGTGLVIDKDRPGVDTLILTFTEQINLESLRGNTLLLIKQGSNEEFILNVREILPHGNLFHVVVDDLGPNAPQENDQLRFVPGSGVVDMRHGATVHPDNRPITLGRRPANDFLVEIRDLHSEQVLNSVRAGDHVRLIVKPRVAGMEPFDRDLEDVWVNLASGNPLFQVIEPPRQVHIDHIPALQHVEAIVYFTTVPEGGIEYVEAADELENPGFSGRSNPIEILPGDPESIVFTDPVSKNHPDAQPSIIMPGQNYIVNLTVYDRFGNLINTPTQVAIESLDENIGTIEGERLKYTDESGSVQFYATITGGRRDDIYTLRATLMANGAVDEGELIVGRDPDRLAIFYADTVDYNPAAVLSGEAGQRLPVVIRALGGEDGNQLVTDRANMIHFSFDPYPGLEVYTSADSESPVTSVNLQNGEIRVWVKGLIEIDNGTISVSAQDDPTITSASRSNIFFYVTSADIDYGAVFADNGNGRVNRMEVYYNIDITEETIPDSIELFWPNRTDGYRRVASGSGQIVLNSPRHITVNFPEEFPQGYTTYSGRPDLGTHFFYNPLTPDIPGVEALFRVVDSVGPLIKSGMVSEKIGSGVDTLLLTFTEDIVLSNLLGQSLLLRKQQEDQTEIPVTVLNVLPQGDHVKLVTADMGQNAPQKGDLLRFNPNRNIIDARDGARVHPENRAVILGLRPIPPGIDSAFYFDTNADGIVNQVRIWFNKDVNKNDLQVELFWTGNNQTDPLEGERIAYHTDNSSITVDISQAFHHDVPFQTSGNMITQIKVDGFDEPVAGTVRDRAAPVIVDALYSLGKVLSEGIVAEDTLTITFSEAVAEDVFSPIPFKLKGIRDGFETGYTFTVEYHDRDALKYRFIVKGKNPPHMFVASGDSVFIHTEGNVRDQSNNVQSNPENRRVLLRTGEIPVSLRLAVGPNPCKVGDGPVIPGLDFRQGMAFVIEPDHPMAADINLNASLAIYDNMGNVVYTASIDDRTVPGKILHVWDLRNRNQRLVSTGTYLAIVNAVSPDNPNVNLSEQVKISVNR
ncbi:hypothetical protein CHISP_3081 [Chitinispirillum alkaliphilum]|nr:hypothetical protein CHISP_3081 [Chitinispirillum alkaliphilum]